MLDKSQEIRADILLASWARWAKTGLAKTGYPTKPVWSNQLPDDSVYFHDATIEECNAVIARAKPEQKSILQAYYGVLFPMIKRKNQLTSATKLFMKQNTEFKPSSQRINATIKQTRIMIFQYVFNA